MGLMVAVLEWGCSSVCKCTVVFCHLLYGTYSRSQVLGQFAMHASSQARQAQVISWKSRSVTQFIIIFIVIHWNDKIIQMLYILVLCIMYYAECIMSIDNVFDNN